MLIFQTSSQFSQKPPGWLDSFRKSLISKCHKFIKTNYSRPKLISKPKLWSNFQKNKQYIQNNKCDFSNHGQGQYSQYIPISQNQYQTDQLSQYLPYLRYQSERNRSTYQACIFNISQEIQSSKDKDKWIQITNKFLPCLTVQQMIKYYLILLAKGPNELNQIRLQKYSKCMFSPFFQRVMEIKKFIGINLTKYNPHLTISLDRGDIINLQNLSKTMKYLFCSICMIYDCQKHPCPAIAIQNQLQYIHQFDIKHRLNNRLITALKLFQHLFNIQIKQYKKQDQFCDQKCYKFINKNKWEEILKQKKSRVFSPIFETIVKMGIQLYHFNPCKIKILFSNFTKINDNTNLDVTCSLIFSYLLQEYNLEKRLQIKFYQTQTEQLLNQTQDLVFSTGSQGSKKIKINKQTKTIKHGQYKSVCFHYFLNKQPFDTNCLLCDCQQRGYCIPSCGCSQDCQIKMRGCRCKKGSNCWQSKCYCFKNGLTCLPQICENCFSNKDQNICCKNNEKAIHKSKSTRIGKSNIQNAGLGLFANEDISKGQFIIKYVGQIIQSISLQKFRQNLIKNNMFYTFKLNQNQSIDSRIYGNKARFINHSNKHANIIPKTIKINQQLIIVFHAIKDIKNGEQLLFNYNGQGQLNQFKNKYPFID